LKGIGINSHVLALYIKLGSCPFGDWKEVFCTAGEF